MRLALLALGRLGARCVAPFQLLHDEGRAHPINRWLASFPARAFALAALLVLLVVLNQQGVTSLLAWTARVFPKSHYPILFASYWVAYVVLRRCEGGQRKRILLVLSVFSMGVFHPLFAAGWLAYFALYYQVVFARVGVWAKRAFLLASFIGLGAACDVALFPRLAAAHPLVVLFGYVFALGYTFRIFYFFHEMKLRGFKRVPRLEYFLYFVFAPYFIIVPYMAAIPRYRVFVAGLERGDAAIESAGLRTIMGGIGYTALFWLLRQFYSPSPGTFVDLLAAGHYAGALAAGLFSYPIYNVVSSLGDAYILIGLIQVLGVDVALPFRKPLSATSILEWWRRWNTHFRDFLVDLFFYPIVLRWRRRNPYLNIVAGCFAVFVIGSVAFHLPKWHVSHNSHAHIMWPSLAENALMFAIVSVLLCLEKRRKRRGEKPRARPMLSDFETPVLRWLAHRLGMAGRIVSTWMILLGVVGGANYALDWHLHHERHPPIEWTQGEAMSTETIRANVKQYILERSELDDVETDRNLIESGVLPSIELLDLVMFVADAWRVEIEEADIYGGRLATIDSITDMIADRQASR